MGGDLRGDYIRNELLPRADDRRRSFVAGAFDAEDVSVGHEPILLDLRCRFCIRAARDTHSQSQPLVRAIREASTRLLAPILLMASDR
jgi:hypothetical protein